MVWKEADLFRHCAIKHSDMAPNQALGEHTYAAVWSALRSWLLAVFNRCRGCAFPTFARITWRRVGDQLEDGVPMMRPVFVPSDAYLRAHLLHTGSGVTRANNIEAEELELCEDYSAMKIAIKFSCALNKDVVFCCTRHLLHHLGEALRSGRPLELDLGVGVLTGRDRCLAFRFHSQYLSHWPATAAARLAPKAAHAAASAAPLPCDDRGQRATEENPRLETRPTSLSCGGSSGGTPAAEEEQHVHGTYGGAETHTHGSGHWQRGPQVQGSQGRGQQCLSPRPGDDRSGRQQGRHTGPPQSPRTTRPAWGARVPPPPPSPGRRGGGAAAAAPLSPPPLTARHGGRPATASPGADPRPVDSDPHPHQRSQPQEPSLASGEAVYDRPYSPGGGGSLSEAAAVDAALPVCRMLQLASRTPRQRPTSPGPPARRRQSSGPQPRHLSHPGPAPQSSGCCGTASVTEVAAAAAARCRPLSAPRCRPGASQCDTATRGAEAAESHSGRRPVSPGPGGAAAAAPRPPWGSGLGTRGRSASAGGSGAARPSSAPRLRSDAGGAPRLEGADERQVRRHWPGTAWAPGGSCGDNGGCGSGGGVDVQQLWSPDNNLKAAAGRGGGGGAGGNATGSRGARAGSARVLFGGGHEPVAVGAVGFAGGAWLAMNQQAPNQGGGQRREQHQTPQPWAAEPRPPGGGSDGGLDDHVRSDQRQKPLRRQEAQLNHPQQQQQHRQQSTRKPLSFLTPQKDPARPAAAPAPRGQPRDPAPSSPQVSKARLGAPLAEAALPSRWAAGAPTGPPVGPNEEEADHSPQLRRDQSVRLGAHSEQPRDAANPVGAAAVGGGGAVHPGGTPRRRALVRTFSPRAEPQPCNLRYGTPTKQDLPYYGGDTMATAAGGEEMVDCGAAVAAAAAVRGAGAVAMAAAAAANGAGNADRSLALCAAAASTSAAAASSAALVSAEGCRGNTPRPRSTAGPPQGLLLPALQARPSPPPPRSAPVPHLGGPATAARAPERGEGMGPNGEWPSLSPAPSRGLPGETRCGDESDDVATWMGCSFGSDVSSAGVSVSGQQTWHEARAARGEDGSTASDAGRGVAGNGSMMHGEELFSSCCGVRPSLASLDVGYALPLYESSIDGSSSSVRSNGSSRGATVAAAPRTTFPAAHAAADPAVPSTPVEHKPQDAPRLSDSGSVAATVRAALGRQRRTSGGFRRNDPDTSSQVRGTRAADWGRASPDELAAGAGDSCGSRNTTRRVLQRLRGPTGAPGPLPGRSAAAAPLPRDARQRDGDAFTVPVIITEEDLPQPAWE